MLAQKVTESQITPVMQARIASADPKITIDTMSEVGRVSGLGRIFIIMMILKNKLEVNKKT
jgi:hypothetical protein